MHINTMQGICLALHSVLHCMALLAGPSFRPKRRTLLICCALALPRHMGGCKTGAAPRTADTQSSKRLSSGARAANHATR